MPRGGYRSPKGGPRASGVGKNSERSDAAQPIRVPNVQDSTDLTMGDRRNLEEGQRIAPVGRAAAPRLSPPPAATGRGSASPLGLPDYLATMPSSRPDEPITAGMDVGAGPGSEVLTPPPPDTRREEVLQFLVDNFEDEATFNMLNEIRQAKVTPSAPRPMAQPIPTVEPEAPTELDEPEPIAEYDDFATEEDVAAEGGTEDQTSVETPSAATPTEAPIE